MKRVKYREFKYETSFLYVYLKYIMSCEKNLPHLKFSPNTGKYEAEKTLYLDTFHVVEEKYISTDHGLARKV